MVSEMKDKFEMRRGTLLYNLVLTAIIIFWVYVIVSGLVLRSDN